MAQSEPLAQKGDHLYHNSGHLPEKHRNFDTVGIKIAVFFCPKRLITMAFGLSLRWRSRAKGQDRCHIRTHNTAMKKRQLDCGRCYPAICRQTDADPATGCMEFDLAKGRFSFRLPPHTARNGGRQRSKIPRRQQTEPSRLVQKFLLYCF